MDGMGGMGGMGGAGMSNMGAAKNAKKKTKKPKQPWGAQRSKEPIESVAHERGPIQDFSPKGLPQFHKGGKVKKGGVAKIAKGEEVLTAKEAKEYHKLKRVAGNKQKLRFRKSRNRKMSRTKRIVSK